RRLDRRLAGLGRDRPRRLGRPQAGGVPARRHDLQGHAPRRLRPQGAPRRHGPRRRRRRGPLLRRPGHLALARPRAAPLRHPDLQRLDGGAVEGGAHAAGRPGPHPHPRPGGGHGGAPARGEARAARLPRRPLSFTGILPGHPKLHFVLVECGIGWIPYFVERMDQTFNKHRFWTKSVITEKPSTYWYHQGHATFIQDLAGVAARHRAGLRNIMWSTDYPHSDSTWPKSREALAAHFQDVPESERALIAGGNAAALYG